MAQGSRDTIAQRIALEGGDQVKQQLADIGKEGERAFRQIEDASQASHSKLSLFSQRMQGVIGGFRSFAQGVRPIGDALGRLHDSANRFGGSLRDTAERVMPHFSEVVPIGIAAAAAGFLELAKSSAEAVRNTENLASTLGIAVPDLEKLRLAASGAGVSEEALTTGLSRFARAVGQAREEHAKLTGQLDTGAQVLRGNAGAIAASENVIRGGVHNANAALFDQTAVLRGGVRPVLDFSDGLKALGIRIADFPDNARGFVLLLQEASRRLGALGDSSVKAAIGQQTFGRSWHEVLPAITDLEANLRKAGTTIDAFAIGIERAESQQASAFNASLSTLRFVAARMGEIVGNIFGQILVPFFDAVTALIGNNVRAIRAWAEGIAEEALPKVRAVIGDLIRYIQGASRAELSTEFAKNLIHALETAAQAARLVVGIIVGGFRRVSNVLEPVAQLINRIFGTELTGDTLAAAAAIFYLIGGFGLLGSAIGVVVAAFGVLAAAFESVPAAIIAGLIAAGIAIAAWWPEIKQRFNEGVAELAKVWSDGIKIWQQRWADFKEWLFGLLGSIGDKIKAIWSSVASLIGMSSGATPAGGTAPGFAAGGDVRGPSGTDQVPIWATAGEFVTRLSAVRYYGVDFFRRLNAMQLPRFEFGGLVPHFADPMQHFATGGVVNALAAAPGGLPSSGFTIVLDGQAFQAATDEATAASLARFARGAQIRSAGRRPSHTR